MIPASTQLPNMYEPHGEVTTKLWLLLPLRFYVGVGMILGAFSKINERWLSDPGVLAEMFRSQVIENPDYHIYFYRWLAETVYMPLSGSLSAAIVFVELVVGIALVLGLLVRWSCVGGFLLTVNCFFYSNVPSFIMEKTHPSVSFTVIFFVLMLTDAGRSYGIDHYLKGRLPRWLV